MKKRQKKKLDNIISVRITNEEKEILQQLKIRTLRTSSQLMRECLTQLLARHNSHQPDRKIRVVG